MHSLDPSLDRSYIALKRIASFGESSQRPSENGSLGRGVRHSAHLALNIFEFPQVDAISRRTPTVFQAGAESSFGAVLVVAYCRLPQAGELNLPGLFAVARQSILRSGLASARARRTPSAS